jgi:hypothetical protein
MEKTEQAVFDELGKLCVSPGYIQALAFICFNDNLIGIGDELSGQDFLKMYSWDRLISTEIMTLVGLMVKRPIDFTLPDPTITLRYIDETHRLMKELHTAMSSPFFGQITPEKAMDPAFNPFVRGSALREPIFYSGEAAYAFQFRDLASPKYAADNAWLEQHKGFSIDEAHRVAKVFAEVQNRNLTRLLETQRQKPPSERLALGTC